MVAGGKDGPLIHFIAHMGKEFGENATLGSELMSCLVDASLSKGSLFVMVRTAVFVTNICWGKITDGIAKLITKTDFMGLKAKKHETMLFECEEFLRMAWEKIQHSSLDKPTTYKVFALAAMRTTLLMFKKEKQGREGKVYSLNEIQTLFNDGLKTGDTSQSSQAAHAASSTQKKHEVVSLDDSHNAMFLAKKNLGLQIGSCYHVKDQGSRVWTLETLTDTEISVVHHPLLEPSKKLTMKFSAVDAMEHLKITKQKLPVLFGNAELTALFPTSDQEETTKCQIFMALHEIYMDQDLDVKDMCVQKTPKVTIFAQKDAKAKSLKLVPVPETTSNVVFKQPSVQKFGICKFKGKDVFILPPRQLKFPKAEDLDQNVKGMFAPFWYCHSSKDGGILEIKTEKYDSSQGQLHVQVLYNPEAVTAHQELLVKDAKGEAAGSSEPAKKKKKAT